MTALPGCWIKRAYPFRYKKARHCCNFSGIKSRKIQSPFFIQEKIRLIFCRSLRMIVILRKIYIKKPDGYSSRRAVSDMEDTHDQF